MFDVKRAGLCVFLLSALVVGFLFSACAPVSYNRYQPAEPLGKGEMKLMASTNLASNFFVMSGAEIELERKMKDKEDRYEKIYPGSDLDRWEPGEIISESMMAAMMVTTMLTPDIEVLYAVGVHDIVDLEVRMTLTGYLRVNTKVQATKLGKRGSLSIAPGLGLRPLSYEDDVTDEDVRDELNGWVTTVELPVLFGWKFEHVSPYVGLYYTYHYLDVALERTYLESEPLFHETVQGGFHFNNVGLILGSQFKWGKFIMTPEIVGMYVFTPLDSEPLPLLWPGLALGAQW